jgi:hypothetical protein
LEHLIDPWDTLEKTTSFLRKEGLLIISIPNIREIKTMFNIFFKGDFRYQDKGILDKTHLRFFCKKNIIELVEGAHVKILEIRNIYGKLKGLSNLLTLGIFRDFFVAQYIVISKKY